MRHCLRIVEGAKLVKTAAHQSPLKLVTTLGQLFPEVVSKILVTLCTDQFKEGLLESVRLAEGCHLQPSGNIHWRSEDSVRSKAFSQIQSPEMD